MKESSETANASMIFILVLTFILNQIFTGAEDELMSLIRALQLIFHLPMFMINTPTIVSAIFEVVIPIAMFDILSLF